MCVAVAVGSASLPAEEEVRADTLDTASRHALKAEITGVQVEFATMETNAWVGA